MEEEQINPAVESPKEEIMESEEIESNLQEETESGNGNDAIEETSNELAEEEVTEEVVDEEIQHEQIEAVEEEIQEVEEQTEQNEAEEQQEEVEQQIENEMEVDNTQEQEEATETHEEVGHHEEEMEEEVVEHHEEEENEQQQHEEEEEESEEHHHEEEQQNEEQHEEEQQHEEDHHHHHDEEEEQEHQEQPVEEEKREEEDREERRSERDHHHDHHHHHHSSSRHHERESESRESSSRHERHDRSRYDASQDKMPERTERQGDERGRHESRETSERRHRTRSRSRSRDREPKWLVEDGNKLYIGNLDYQTTDDDLRSAFGKYGNLTGVHIMRFRSGESRGFGFILFSSEQEAKEALVLNRSELHGRPLRVDIARPMKQVQMRHRSGPGMGHGGFNRGPERSHYPPRNGGFPPSSRPSSSMGYSRQPSRGYNRDYEQPQQSYDDFHRGDRRAPQRSEYFESRGAPEHSRRPEFEDRRRPAAGYDIPRERHDVRYDDMMSRDGYRREGNFSRGGGYDERSRAGYHSTSRGPARPSGQYREYREDYPANPPREFDYRENSQQYDTRRPYESGSSSRYYNEYEQRGRRDY
eukprot:TRINITY_DN273_c0_g4_i2.p1 TRINITY_DN273_c0_g4~~TRINITY_DN273_c0_g4_i2.p1  ORF type:complete len:606 (+),score=248.23 TRINITY_DN273_c0_g4_i2:60-1820(+)